MARPARFDVSHVLYIEYGQLDVLDGAVVVVDKMVYGRISLLGVSSRAPHAIACCRLADGKRSIAVPRVRVEKEGSMFSQIDFLKEEIPRLTALLKSGADNPFVKGLTQQLAGLESQLARQDERQERIERYLLGGGKSFVKDQPKPPTSEPVSKPAVDPSAGSPDESL